MTNRQRVSLVVAALSAVALLVQFVPSMSRLVRYRFSYRTIANDVEFVAIRSQLGEPKGVLVRDGSAIESLLSCLSMRTHSVMPCGYDYVIDVHCKTRPNYSISINTDCGYYTSDIPEFLGVGERDTWYAFSGSMRSIYSSFFAMIDTAGSYFYRVSAPPGGDYDSISAAIRREEGLRTILFDKDELRRNVYIRMSYTDSCKNYPGLGLDAFMEELELGEFEGDTRFLPLVEKLRASSCFLGCSRVRFKMGSADYFQREIRVYVPLNIAEQLVDSMRREWEPDEFEFVTTDGYPFFLVSEERITGEEMTRLVSEYALCKSWDCPGKRQPKPSQLGREESARTAADSPRVIKRGEKEVEAYKKQL